MTTTPRGYGLTVTRKPDGCDLDTTGYVTNLLRDFLNLLAEDGDLREQLDLLLDTDPPKHDPHMPDVASRDDVFLAAAVAALNPASLTIRLDESATRHLAGQLTAIADQRKPTRLGAVPQQRGGEAA